jgi:hypothetical protein
LPGFLINHGADPLAPDLQNTVGLVGRGDDSGPSL